MNEALLDHKGTISIGGRAITNVRFADDIDGLAGSEMNSLIWSIKYMLPRELMVWILIYGKHKI